MFRQLNIFVRIVTPWREAEEHVAVAGSVPVLCSGDVAERFQNYHLSVEIDAPQVPRRDSDNRAFLVLLDDLPLFCKMWFYSDLNYAGDLNRYLRLTLTVRDPFAQPYDDTAIPKALQRRCFEPFGCVKGLRELRIEGAHHGSLERALRAAQAEPYDAPQKCLQEAMALKEAGNEALGKRDPRRAIELYFASFEKIHIVCVGRRRAIWADAFFETSFSDGPYKDQHGQVVRLNLRVALVANLVKAYLDLEEYEEAEFWGMRAIRLLREATGMNLEEAGDTEEAVLNFAAAEQMGKIYYRTGIAQKALGKKTEAWKLLKVASQYLPHDVSITQELASLRPDSAKA